MKANQVDVPTTEAQKMQHHAYQPPPSPCRPKLGIKKIQQVEKIPESTTHATFPPHQCSPPIKATSKHKEFLSLKGDKSHCNFASHYEDAFQGTWSHSAQPVERHTSSVHIGDPKKILERETTHALSFNQPKVCRPTEMNEHLKLRPGNFHREAWSSTSKEAFCYHKTDPVVFIKRNQNISSLPEGDIDKKRNTERMSVTTNRLSFSDPNDKHQHMTGPDPDLITRSHVHFSQPRLSGLYYSTTAREHYCKRDVNRTRPVVQLQRNTLNGAEYGPHVSTTKADFLPFKTSARTPCPSQQTSNLRFPLGKQRFNTTNMDVYTVKPLAPRPPTHNKCLTRF
ncbi:uncharacterized protein ACNS7B_003920 [Menidia menidia]